MNRIPQEMVSSRTIIHFLLNRSAIAPPNGERSIWGTKVTAMMIENILAEPVRSRMRSDKANLCRLFPNNDMNCPTDIMVKLLLKSLVVLMLKV